MVELLIILALGVEYFPIFDRTEVFRLVVSKNLKFVYTCVNGSVGYVVDSKM